MGNHATNSRLSPSTSPLGGLLLAAVGAGLGTIVRRGLVEPVEIGAICESSPPWWCEIRLAVLDAASFHLVGLTALAAAFAALLLPRGTHRVSAGLALLGGGIGMALYDASAGASAVVIALLVLAERRDAPAYRASSAAGETGPNGG